MTNIEKLRVLINDIDAQILELLGKRKTLARQVVDAKIKEGRPVRDIPRERELIKGHIVLGRKLGLDVQLVSRVFREVIDDSVRTQHDSLVATQQPLLTSESLVGYHGARASYCYLALNQYCSGKLATPRMQGYEQMEDLIKAVKERRLDAAIIPVENAVRGTIQEIMDLLISSHLSIVGEEVYKVEHCLLGRKGAVTADIVELWCSHLAFLDCREFVSKVTSTITYVPDSAWGAEALSRQEDSRKAVIASEEAAEEFGLDVLERDIATQRNNLVRYFLVSAEPHVYDMRIPCKTSLLFATSNDPGSLVEALKVFDENNISLSKLDSHPVIDNPWKEQFYVDFEGNVEDPIVADTIKELERHAHFVRVLGSYPSMVIR
jgi:chorismate mutase/prephenate dehydratase